MIDRHSEKTLADAYPSGNSDDLRNHQSSLRLWEQVQTTGTALLQEAGSNSSVSKSDLTRLLKNSQLEEREAPVAAALYINFDAIKNSSNNKIDVQDIRRFTSKSFEAESSFKQADRLSYWAEDQGALRRLSGGHSNSLTLNTIRAEINDGSTNPEDSQFLSFLSENFSSFSRNARLGSNEIDRLYESARDDQDFRLGVKFQNDMKRVESTQDNPAAHRLYATEGSPLSSITPEAVRQGLSGNCAIEAALAGLANYRPGEIEKMIISRGGSFDINFPGKESISVKQPGDAQLGLFAPDANYGFWPALLSAAYGQDVYNNASREDRARMNSELPDEWASESGDQKRAIETLTGHSVFDSLLSKLSDQNLSKMLLTGQEKKSVMALNTAPGTGETADGFKLEHAFSVLRIDNSREGMRITIRDPQGKGANRPDGTMQISLAQLRSNFNAIFIEET